MPLYGHELTDKVDPFQAGLGFACHLVGYNFPGRDALVRIQSQAPQWVRVGLELEGRRMAREGSPVLAEGRPVGTVTSGTFGPTVQKAIAMAYVRPECAQPGTKLLVDVRGRQEPACVVELPFYRRDH